MKPETEQLLATLKIVTQNLYYMSETDAPYEPFVWDVAEKGSFHFLRVLESLNYLVSVPKDQVSQSNPQLIKTLEENLSHLSFFSFGGENLTVGDTTEGDWVGVSQKFSYDTCAFGDRYHPPTTPTTPATKELQNQIAPLLSGQVCESAATQEELILKLLSSSDLVEIWHFEGFREADKLNRFLTTQLKDVLTYVFIGENGGFDIYTLGETPTGDYLGVSTVAIWT